LNNKYFNKLPGHHATAYGLEWKIFRKMHWIALAATAIPLLYVWTMHLFAKLNAHDFQLVWMKAAGMLLTLWIFVVVLFFGCVVVIIMKGPAYVADPYYMEEPASDEETDKDADS